MIINKKLNDYGVVGYYATSEEEIINLNLFNS